MTHCILGALVAAVCAAALHGADTAWPDLPDPIGLGPRLVTITWLGERGHRITPGAPDADIQAAYARLHAAEAARSLDAAAVARDEEARLRYLLRANHAIEPAAGTDGAVLTTLLAEAEARQRQAELDASSSPTGRISIVPNDQPSAEASDTVPLRYQICFKDLLWRIERDDTVSWRRSGNRSLPDEIGSIWARQVHWNGVSYRILTYHEEQPEPTARFAITTEIGSFRAIRLTEDAWEMEFTDNAGTSLTFRTNASDLVIVQVAREAKDGRGDGRH